MEVDRWEGACNARDLGGLRLEGGGWTATGRIARSGSLRLVTPTGWAALGADVRTIVDLRNADERARDAASHAALAAVDVLHRPVEDQGDERFMERYGPLLGHPCLVEGLVDHTPGMLAYAVAAVGTATGPVVFHCSAGRDRTGVVASLLLRLNGVVIDDVLADHERGVRGYAGWERANPGRSRDRELSAAELDEVVAERLAWLREWLDRTDVDELVRGRLGLSDEVVDAASSCLRS